MKNRPAANSTGSFKLLPALHILCIAGLASGWVYYCASFLPKGVLAKLVNSRTRDIVIARYVQPLLNDVLLGSVTLAVFALGTGLFVHRLQVWIEGRGSGQAIALRGANLHDQAIAANPTTVKDRGLPIPGKGRKDKA
jgi:hypothetical protein